MEKNDTCRLCLQFLPKKSRRNIFSETFLVKKQLVEVLGVVPNANDGLSPYACYKCFGKLNKLNKIDYDLENRLNVLRNEKKGIISELRSNLPVSSIPVISQVATCSQNIEEPPAQAKHSDITPRKLSKRVIIHTPTPRKTKRLFTPAAPGVSSARKRLADQQLTPSKVKVSFQGKADSKLRTRLVKDTDWTTILKSLVRGDKAKTIAKKLYNIKAIKTDLFNLMLTDLNKQCQGLCTTSSPSVLRNKNEAFLKLDQVACEVRENAPMLCSILQTILKKVNDYKLSVAAAVLLRNRNTHMSAVHQIIGQVLDYGGATDETIRILSSMGLSVGPQSVAAKKSSLVLQQEKKVNENFKNHVRQSVLQHKISLSKRAVNTIAEYNVSQDEKKSGNLEFSDMLKKQPTQLTIPSYTNAKIDSTCLPVINSEAYMKKQSLFSEKNVTVLKPYSFNTKLASIEFPTVNLQGLKYVQLQQEHIYTMANHEKTTKILNDFLSRNKDKLEPVPRFEIIGDNLDLTISPTSMTKERQRKSLHWFLNVALQRRVLSHDLPSDEPKADILKVPNSEFLPSMEDCKTLEMHMIYHVAKVVSSNITCLQPLKECIPDHIDHPFIKDVSKKSEYRITDLLDKSENKADDMISILEHIHQNYIPHTDEDPPNIVEKIVFGGDVLTNERAYSAQLAMMNNESNFYRLAGVVHRPEGLHRMMNFLLIIYQQFYKPSSAADQGTLFQLRNVLQRRDVTGPDGVTEKFRAHMAFIQDCLDAFLLAGCLELLDIKSFDEKPNRTKLPEFISIRPKEEQYEWLQQLCRQILTTFVNIDQDILSTVTAEATEMDNQERLMTEMFKPELKQYVCSCNKKYKAKGHFKRHLTKEHNWLFNLPPDKCSTVSSKQDHIAIWRSSFMKLALLLRDTENAYSMGDGVRIFRNAKFEMMCADVARHTKYRLWLWRLKAYECALLSPRESFEYKWNCTANINGGTGKNIPNDNLVEICVHIIKKKLREQGANVTYSSAKKIAKCVQTQDDIKHNLQSQFDIKRHAQNRPNVDKRKDLELIVKELQENEIFKYISGREFSTFKKFEDVFSRVKPAELHKWITSQKERASFEIV